MKHSLKVTSGFAEFNLSGYAIYYLNLDFQNLSMNNFSKN
jgi:hypothetical protein